MGFVGEVRDILVVLEERRQGFQQPPGFTFHSMNEADLSLLTES